MPGKLNWLGKKVGSEVVAQTGTVLTKGAIMVTNQIKKLMREPKSGTRYKGKRRITRSSAPGEAPAVQTGRLRASIHYKAPDPLTRLIGTNLDYGYWLEIGTSKMAARPFLRPAFKQVSPKIVKMLKGLI